MLRYGKLLPNRVRLAVGFIHQRFFKSKHEDGLYIRGVLGGVGGAGNFRIFPGINIIDIIDDNWCEFSAFHGHAHCLRF